MFAALPESSLTHGLAASRMVIKGQLTPELTPVWFRTNRIVCGGFLAALKNAILPSPNAR